MISATSRLCEFLGSFSTIARAFPNVLFGQIVAALLIVQFGQAQEPSGDVGMVIALHLPVQPDALTYKGLRLDISFFQAANVAGSSSLIRNTPRSSQRRNAGFSDPRVDSRLLLRSHSLRRAVIGSTRVARRAGKYAAVAPAAINASETASNVTGSLACTPYSRLSKFSAALFLKPIAGSHFPNCAPYPQRDCQTLRRVAVKSMSSSLPR